MSESRHSAQEAPFDIVVIAASAGGVFAMPTLLSRLPRWFSAAIVVVQHRHPRADYILPIVARRTELFVAGLRPGQRPRAATVYVAPASPQLTVDARQRFRFSAAPRCTADKLMASCAAAYGERAIAVVLTGALADGAAGVRAIKNHGGRVIVQDPLLAARDGMPSAAVATGCADFVLPLQGIADALVSLVTVPGASDLFRTEAAAVAG